jgi:ABC-type dipeptide/oligopeptide/nickel transport system permease subunit
MLPAIAPQRRWPRVVPAVPIALLLLLCAIALLAPWIAPYPPLQGSLGDKLLPPAWLAGGNWSHPLGTDLLGRDILSRIFYGARTSLAVAAIAVILRGRGTVRPRRRLLLRAVDVAIMRLTDVALSPPLILVAIALSPRWARAANGPSSSCYCAPRYARQIRGETLRCASATSWRWRASRTAATRASSCGTSCPT